MRRQLPARERLLRLFDYLDETGILIRKARPREEFNSDRDFNTWNTRWCGKEAGSYKVGGVSVEVDGERYQVHRIIWAMKYDHVPKVIDHEDLNPHNNRINNLREATDGQNTANGNLRKDNITGVKGVSYNKKRKYYQAHISVGGKTICVGRFKTIEEASLARHNAAKGAYGEFARLC